MPAPLGRRLQRAAADLVELHRLEQRLEVALAEALVALALDELEEDRPDHRLGEDLEQQASGTAAVDEDRALPELADRLAVARQPLVEQLVVGPGRVQERDALRFHRIDGRVDVARAEGDVLNALAAVLVEVLL